MHLRYLFAGKECPSVTTASQSCSNGYYSTGSAVACTECPEGYHCNDKITPVKCSAGEYAAAGAHTCSSCSSGFYSSAGASSCTECPAGSQCGNNEDVVACLAGTYSEAGAASCTNCPAGRFFSSFFNS